MILTAAAAVSYLLGYYVLAFWLIVVAIALGLVGAARAFLDPDWYMMRRAAAGAAPTRPGLQLLIVKLVVSAVLAAVSYHIYGLAYPS